MVNNFTVGFKNILIPVDFSDNSDVAIKKAIELCNPNLCRLHLVHVIATPAHYFIQFRWSRISAAHRKYQEKEAERQLRDWKTCIEQNAPNIHVETSIIWDSNIQNSIIIMARRIKADLIVIGKRMNHPWLTFLNTIAPSVVAKMTSCAVLTVKIGSLNSKIKNVVVPIHKNISQSKLDAMRLLCMKRGVKIILVTFVNRENMPDNFSASTLLHVYQWLNANSQCPVEYAVLHGSDRSKAILEFSEKHEADILLLNSKTESKIGWLNRHISEVIPVSSRVQVLTV